MSRDPFQQRMPPRQKLQPAITLEADFQVNFSLCITTSNTLHKKILNFSFNDPVHNHEQNRDKNQDLLRNQTKQVMVQIV